MSGDADLILASEGRSRRERLQGGYERRKHLGRAKFGVLPTRKRGVNPLQVLQAAAKGRVPALLRLKYTRMSASPFAFFRGSVPIMAADLASQPHTGIIVQLCGDAHVQNLGCYGAPDGRLMFDLNDFDETIAGPWEWDVKRMAASIVLAGLESEHTQSSCAGAVESFADSYCTTIETLAEEPILVAARHTIHRIKSAKPISAAWQQAERAQPLDLLKRYTEETGKGAIRFRNIDGQLWRLSSEKRQKVLVSLGAYRESLPPERVHLFDFFRPIDVAFKVVGTGSVGLRNYVVLMGGNGRRDPLFLQIKQEVHSAYECYLQASPYSNGGQRVVMGQHKIQPLSDLLLGWTSIDGHDFLVRQLNDHKGSLNLLNLRGNGLSSLAVIAGELLARGHARSGDALHIKGYIGSAGKIIKAIAKYGAGYAEVTQGDFHAFQKAIGAGQFKTAA
ncbi:MAG: DUF2252 domain-containing protein [Acidobacteriaceae bacterium]|nr:DUF2252 domain-containing protein [Acidobacteriaceae bacterium]